MYTYIGFIGIFHFVKSTILSKGGFLKSKKEEKYSYLSLFSNLTTIYVRSEIKKIAKFDTESNPCILV